MGGPVMCNDRTRLGEQWTIRMVCEHQRPSPLAPTFVPSWDVSRQIPTSKRLRGMVLSLWLEIYPIWASILLQNAFPWIFLTITTCGELLLYFKIFRKINKACHNCWLICFKLIDSRFWPF